MLTPVSDSARKTVASGIGQEDSFDFHGITEGLHQQLASRMETHRRRCRLTRLCRINSIMAASASLIAERPKDRVAGRVSATRLFTTRHSGVFPFVSR